MRNADKISELLETFKSLPPEEQANFAEEVSAMIPELVSDPYRFTETFTEQGGAMVGSGIPGMTNKPAPISTADRLAIKNFGNSLYDSIAFLEKKYPNLEFGHNGTEISARVKGGSEWMPLDPETNPTDLSNWTSATGLAEMAKDLGDVGADVASGAATGAGATVGALAGAGLTLPAGMTGALPGAVMGGAAAGGATESARQGIGRALGVNKAMNLRDILTQTALGGALAPLGTGVGKGFLANAFTKARPQTIEAMRGVLARSTGLPAKDIATWSKEKVIEEAGKLFQIGGALPAGMKAMGDLTKGGTAIVSRTRPETIQYMADNGVGSMARNAMDTRPMAESVQNVVEGAVGARKREAGAAIDKALEGRTINIKDVISRLTENIKDARKNVSQYGKKTVERRDAKKVVKGLKDIADNVQMQRTGKTVDAEGYNVLNKMLGDRVDWAAAAKVTPNPKTTVRAKVGKNAADLKQVLTDAAEAQVPGLKSARQSYEKAVQRGGLAQDLTSSSKWRGDMRRVEQVIGEQGADFNALKGASMDVMTPDEYARFLQDSERLGANLDYLFAKDSFTPTGALSTVGASGALAMKATPAKFFARQGARALSAGQKAGRAGRAATPLSAQFIEEINRQYTPLTADTEEQIKQLQLIEQIKQLAGE